MDYSFCQALKQVPGVPRVTIFYDVMCQWWKNFFRRVMRNRDYLHVPTLVEIQRAIGSFHVHGHRKECFPRFTTLFIEGIGVVDGEVIERLWSRLNPIAPFTRSMTNAHRQETIDAHMNDQNWNKIINMGKPLLLPLRLSLSITLFSVHTIHKRWKTISKLYEDSKKEFIDFKSSLTEEELKLWTEMEVNAQRNRLDDEKEMDVFDVEEDKGDVAALCCIAFQN